MLKLEPDTPPPGPFCYHPHGPAHQPMRFLAARLSRVTRRRLIVCAATAVLALPAEAALLALTRTTRAPNANAAARDWAESLSNGDLQDAAQRIQDYPYFYRRAIMTALEPEDRSAAWRRYLRSYAAARSLDPASRLVINRAIAAMTPEVFDDGAPGDHLAELSAVFDIAVGLFGRRTAVDLFMRFGPDDSAVASLHALPFSERMGLHLRGWLGVQAGALDCDCTTSFAASCDAVTLTGTETCSTAQGCDPDVSWPMSGVAWAFPSNGVCSISSTHAR